MAYDREAFRLRGENARLNFPELFLNKNRAPDSVSNPLPPTTAAACPPNPPPVIVEDDSGIGSSDVTSDEVVAGGGGGGTGEGGSRVAESAEMAATWREMMAEEWFNAIPAGWGPGSAVWDDLDTTNNLLQQSGALPSFLGSNNQNVNDLNQPESLGSAANSSTSSSPPSFSSSFPMKPSFWKDQD